jgi:hypothetical protein
MDGHDRIGAIVHAAEHLLGLGRFHFLTQFLEALGEVGADVFPAISPLGEHGQVIAPPLQRSQEREVFLDAPPALHDFLCFGLVVPERRIGDRLFDVR